MALLKVFEQDTNCTIKNVPQLLCTAHTATSHHGTGHSVASFFPAKGKPCTTSPVPVEPSWQQPPSECNNLALPKLHWLTQHQSRVKCNFFTALVDFISKDMNLACYFGKNNFIPLFS